MQSLQQKASEMSGVRLEEAFKIDEVNLFERLGMDGFVQLSTNFYNRVYSEEEKWFRDIFASSTKEEAIRNQFEFFVQRMGGPPLYSQRKGHPALIGRHGPYDVSARGAERWLAHMKRALEETEAIDPDSSDRMFKFFQHTAYFLVAGKDLVNNQRNVGYGSSKHLGGS